MADGLQVGIDASDLERFSKRMREAQRHTAPVIASGLNEIGDSVVSVLATSINKATGLSLEQVRGMMKVKRANRTSLEYDITVERGLMETKTGRELEGKRESKDFGKQDPNELVIVVTRKDELVCMDCEELEAAGPMPAHVAQEHVPKHPHCRCVIMPYVQKGKRLPVTMTSTTGTSAQRRTGAPVMDDMTIRQIAQQVLDRTATKIRVKLT